MRILILSAVSFYFKPFAYVAVNSFLLQLQRYC